MKSTSTQLYLWPLLRVDTEKEIIMNDIEESLLLQKLAYMIQASTEEKTVIQGTGLSSEKITIRYVNPDALIRLLVKG